MFLSTPEPQDILPDIPTWHDLRHAWHHDILNFVRAKLPEIAIVLLYGFILLRIVLFFVNRLGRVAHKHEATDPRRANELRTLASIIRATSYAVIGFIVLINILSDFGVPTTSLLASAGVVGVGIGLGAQSLFKDIINGVFILLENQYNIGDTVTLASLTGTVEDLSLRLTTLRDGNGTLFFVPNSQIATVQNLSRDFAVANLNIVVDASADPDRVLQILRSTTAAVRNAPTFHDVASDPVIPGIDSINGRAVTYPISIRIAVYRKDDLLRELRRRILQAFEQNEIPLGTDPANLFLAHKSDPTAPPAQQPLTGS